MVLGHAEKRNVLRLCNVAAYVMVVRMCRCYTVWGIVTLLGNLCLGSYEGADW